MRVVAFIEPPQEDVIQKILQHCGLWSPSSPRAPPSGGGSGGPTPSSGEFRELTYVSDADGDSQGAFDEPWEPPYAELDTFDASF
jgi:hypothetical protein